MKSLQEYHLASNDYTGHSVDEKSAVARFERVFHDLKQDNLADAVEAAYAEEFYFNDTFRQLSDRESLKDYMLETSETVSQTTVKILDVAHSNSDYYLRWEMHIKASAAGKDIDSKTVGMTQLRFDEDGKIIFHQDFWDSATGFYQHLPVLGFMIKSVKSRL